ncbi:MAG: alpha/beta hydrolase [Gemmataceae bacterium]|nr:alpha/beta hydrolase [Gemmataceae bacterium]
MLRAIENYFLFKPAKAPQEWQDAPPGETVQDLFLETGQGKIHAWWVPPPEGNPARAVLYCHGNGGNLSFRFEGVRRWRDLLGLGVLIFDYPGYGKSQGKPSEAGCHASAEASFHWLRSQGFANQDLVFHGGSLGGAVATYLAAKFTPAALTLVAAFTSFKDMARNLFPWLPGTSLLKTRFDTLADISRVKSPVFIAHGTEDRLVPMEFGQKLFQAVTGEKLFHAMEGHNHHHSPGKEFYSLLKPFLKKAFSRANQPCPGVGIDEAGKMT